MTTHAHYKGEFGNKSLSGMSKDPAYRAARAQHYARLAQEANEKHASSNTHADRAVHALIVATAVQKTKKHLEAVKKLAPGSEHEEAAFQAHIDAKNAHADVSLRHEYANQTAPSETTRTVHRGLVVSREELVDLHAKVGSKLSNSAHAWWGTHHGLAKTYAETEQIHDDKKIRVVLTGEMRGGPSTNTPALPSIARDKTASVTLRNVHVLGQQYPDSHLAEIIHQTVANAPSSARIGDRKVFSHEIYDAMSVPDKAKFGSLDQFKDKLRDLNRSGHLSLARADLVAAMNPAQVAASHVNMVNVGHHRYADATPHTNFVIDRRFK